MKHAYTFVFILALFGCNNPTSNFHDGEYIFTDNREQPSLDESITIDGNYATLYFRSLFNHSNLSKSEYRCIQYPDRIDLQLRRQPPISIPVDKEGNLMWDEKLFQKQVPLIIQPMPIPKALLEEAE